MNLTLDDVIKAEKKGSALDSLFPSNPWNKKEGDKETEATEEDSKKDGDGDKPAEEEKTGEVTLPAKGKKRKRQEDIYEPPPEEKEAFLKQNPQCDPYMFLAGHKNIIVLGEEDFSLSLDIIKHFNVEQLKSKQCNVVSTAYKPNDYETDFETKFKELHGTIRYNCDAQNASTFAGQKFDGIVFTFPRLYESLDQDYVAHGKKDKWFTGHQYFTMNRAFFSNWLKNARDHLVQGGKIYIVLIANQFESWNLNDVCCKIGLQWALVGEFRYRNCIYYKPKNEKGDRWHPHQPMIFSIFHPIFIPPNLQRPPIAPIVPVPKTEVITKTPITTSTENPTVTKAPLFQVPLFAPRKDAPQNKQTNPTPFAPNPTPPLQQPPAKKQKPNLNALVLPPR